MTGISRDRRGALHIRLTVAAIAVAATCLAAAAPAGAIIVRLKDGHYLSYMAMSPSSSGSGTSGGAASPPAGISSPLCARCDSIRHSLDYGGGPVMTSNTNYVIAWIPHSATSPYTGNPFQDNEYASFTCPKGGDSCGYMYGVAQFFKDLAAASGTDTNADSVSTQYNQADPTATAAYNSHFGACTSGTCGPNGVFLDTGEIPGGASGCPDTATSSWQRGDAKGSGGFCITDAQIQTELNSFLAAHDLPRGLTHEYFLLTPPDVVSCQDAAGKHCSANAPQANAEFCGYHSYGGPASNGFLYANIPDSSGTTTSTLNDGIDGCDPFATATECVEDFVCNYNETLAEGSLSAVSHEHNESVTDPQPPTGWNDDESNSPYTGGDEIGDLCNADAADDPQTQYQFNVNTDSGTPYNYTINGDHYWLQMLWSNQGASCTHSLTPDSPPGASFTVASQNGDNVVFNAASSCGNASCASPISEFVWQTDDFVQSAVTPGGPNGLVHSVTCPFTHSSGDPAGCDGEYFAHAFPERGTYDVAITTQTADGRSFGGLRQVHIYAAPEPSLSAARPWLARALIHFSSQGTTHDPSLSIRSYLWHFGDGSTSTAANPAHAYTAPGKYNVTLTVTDSAGQKATNGGQITIAASCKVPGLKGKSLSAAKTAITAAGCSVGSVGRPSKKTGTKLVVGSQSPAAGTIVPKGTAVKLKMVWE